VASLLLCVVCIDEGIFGNKKNLDFICYSVRVFQKQIRFNITFSNFISKSRTIQTYFLTLFVSKFGH
jgi:hypothetical protein